MRRLLLASVGFLFSILQIVFIRRIRPLGLIQLWLFIFVSINAFGQPPFISAATGSWNSGATWGRAGNVAGTDFPIAGQAATISGGTTVTVPSGTFSVGNLAVANNNTAILIVNGVLQVSGAITGGATRGFLNVFGTLTLNDGSTVQATWARLAVKNGGAIEMNYTTGGTAPAVTYEAGSILRFTNYSSGSALTPSFEAGIQLQNVEWNCQSQGNDIFLNGAMPNTSGYFKVLSTGSLPWYLVLTSSVNYTVTIGTNLEVSGGGYLVLTDGTGSSTMTVNQNVSVLNSGSELDLKQGSGIGTLNVKGNLTLSSGTIGTFSIGAGEIVFNGSSTQTFAQTGSAISTNVNYTVFNFSKLDLGTSAVTGPGKFTINDNATLYLGSTDASGVIQNSPANVGNIQVSGTRTYSSLSSIVLNGGGAQKLGNGFPSNVNLEIANINGVTNNNVGITNIVGDLTLTSGAFFIGSGNTLDVKSNLFVTSGTIGGGSTANLTFSGSGSLGTLTFASGAKTLNNLTIGRTGTVTLGSDLTVGGTIALSFGNLDFSDFTLTMNGGSITSSSTGLKSSSTSNLTFGGSTYSGSIPFSGAGNQLNNLTFSTPGGTFTWNSTVTVNGNVSLTAGTLTHSSGLTMASNSTFIKGGGTFAAGSVSPVAVTSYNVVYNGTGNTDVELPSSATALQNLTVASSGVVTLTSNVTINGALTLSGGTFAAGSNSIGLKGNFVSNTSSTLTSSAFTFSGTTILSGSFTPIFGAITISGALTPSSSFQVNGNLVNNGTLNAGSATTTFGGTTAISGSSTSSFNNVVISGTLTAPSTSMNVAGNFTNNGTFNHNNGSITFNGTTSILGSATTNLYGVNIIGSLTAPSTTLNIAGNWATSGTFTHNGGKVVLNGTVALQSVTGSVSLQDIDISNPTGISNNGAINLNGVLTLVSSGVFDADGSGAGVLTIKSTAVNAGGRIAALPTPANFSGLVTVERFINGPDSWRYLSMPLTNGNVGMWKANFPVTGNFSDPSPAGVNGVVSSSAHSISFWNAATQAYVEVGSGGSTASTSLSNLVGYEAYTYLSSNFTASVRGSIRTGNASIPLTTSAFNLVPNPYPSPIDWDNMNRTGLNSTIYIRVSNNVFASYVAGGLATNAPFVAWTGEVAIGQSFWIQSSGASTLSLTESAKTSNAYQFLRESAPRNYVRVVLSSDKQRDEALVWFNENASAGFDDAYDSRKMRNGYFTSTPTKNAYLNISTFQGDTTTEYSINSMSKLKCNNTVGMKVTDVAPGEYTLSFEDMETMDFGYQVILVDHFTKVEKQVDSNLEYTFTVTTDKSTFGNSRFELRFLLPGSTWINSVQAPKTFVTNPCDFKQLGISIDTQQGATYQFFRGSVPVTDVLVGSGSAVMTTVAKDMLALGNNELNLQVATQSGCDSYVFAKVISYNYQVLDPVTITKDGLILKSSSADGNQWFKNGVVIDGATGSQFEVQESANYTVQVSKGACTVSSEIDVDLTTDVIQVFPVPTDGKVNLILPPAVNASLKGISLYDV
ncbi:MAG TPA: hypothetical protein VGQ53_06410, partial [Chitinophagaceae bacterium]|nr:hypothetical protein [Chitinophagaceae bacterium]